MAHLASCIEKLDLTKRVLQATNLPAGYRRRFCTVLFSLLFLSFAGCNHDPDSGKTSPIASPAQISSSAQVVKISTDPVSVPVNGSAISKVTLSISPGFHVNANPATFPYLIATEVLPTVAHDVYVEKSIYPPPTKKKFQFAEEPLAVYEGDAPIQLLWRSSGGMAKKGEDTLSIKVRVQACDNEKCYPPATINGSITVNVN